MHTNKIHILDSTTAERIAAGEVIERPSGAVKELVENALDAKATEVWVQLEEGGRTLIEILDNGYGMGPEDLSLCLKRHATSKIVSLDDLERLHTLGFRGEALASLSAASDVSIVSRTNTSSSAYQIETTSGNLAPVTALPFAFGHFLGSDHGTRVRASALFAQVPARLKFLKSPASEVAQVREWLERLSLTRPDCGFRLSSHDRKVLDLPKSNESKRVSTILQAGSDFRILTESQSRGEIGVRIHWVEGLALPHSRKVFTSINGRAVRDRLVQQAVFQAFKQSLLPGHYPAIALFIEIDPALLDVNVHPTKAEVRFARPADVFDAVRGAVNSLVDRKVWRAPEAAISPMPILGQALAPQLGSTRVTQTTERERASLWVTPVDGAQLGNEFTPSCHIGNLFNTYLVFDLGDELGLIDQHAAHERVRYEELRKGASSHKIASQALLLPEVASFDPEKRSDIEARLHWLANLGFEAEVFGESSVVFRALPAAWGDTNLRTRLKNLVERLLECPEADASTEALAWDEIVFEKLAMEACKSSIRAGDRIVREEAHALINRLFACEHPWNCPHGRPTTVRIPKGRVEEWFQRRL